jgi:hypothetical protein
MAVPVPRTWVASEFETATIFNGDHRDSLNFLLAPPRCHAYRSAAGSHVLNGNWDVVALDGELYDPYATPAHDNATNNSRLVAAETGLYKGVAAVGFVANATGHRGIKIRKNAAGSDASGTEVTSTLTAAFATFGWQFTMPFQVQLNANDYIELFAYQSSGGNLGYLENASRLYLMFKWDSKL